jgi:hypothetical protein
MNPTRPADQCYWAVLEAGPCRAGPLPPGLRSAFEEECPVQEGSLHVVCVPLAGHGVLACGVPHDGLQELAAHADSLTPESIPDLGPDHSPRPDALNFLVGPYEPLRHRRARTRRHLTAMALVAACAGAIWLGLHRRAEHWRLETATTTAAADEAVHRAIPDGTLDALRTEVAAARQASTLTFTPPPDASLALASLISSWPTQVPAKPLSLSVNGDAAAMAVLVEGDASRFLTAFSAPGGWSLGEPKLSNSGGLARLNLELRRIAEARR